MIKIAVIAHGTMAQAIMLVAKQMSYKSLEDVKVFSVDCCVDVNQVIGSLKAFFEENRANGVLVLADIFGGSGCNISILSAKEYDNVQVVSGLNLAMLASALQNKDSLGLEELSAKVAADAKRSIINVTDFLKQNSL